MEECDTRISRSSCSRVTRDIHDRVLELQDRIDTAELNKEVSLSAYDWSLRQFDHCWLPQNLESEYERANDELNTNCVEIARVKGTVIWLYES